MLTRQERFPAVEAIQVALEDLVARHAANEGLHRLPQAVEFLVTSRAVSTDALQLQHLSSWQAVQPDRALLMLNSSVGR